MNKKLPVFHLAFPIKDVSSTIAFYKDKLGFSIDLVEEKRCIINLCGHQAVAHVSEQDVPADKSVTMYPRHFGIVFENESEFEALLARAKESHVNFFQEAFTRFPDSPRKHRSFFLQDPSNNLLEFKWYADPTLLHSNKE